MQNIESVTPQRHILPHYTHISKGHKRVDLADRNEPLAWGGVVSILEKVQVPSVTSQRTELVFKHNLTEQQGKL